MFRRSLMMPVIFAGFALLPLTAWADDPIGTIVAIEGTVTLSHDGDKKTAIANMPIYENDAVETGKKSKICIIFIDNTWFILGENGKLTVDDYVYDPDSMSDNKGRFSIPKGPFSYTSGQLDKNSKPDVEITAGYSSLGIRGTEALGGNDGKTYGIFDKSGHFDVKTDGGTVKLGPGLGTDLNGGDQPPGLPKKWSQDKINRLLRQLNFDDPGALAALITAMEKQNRKHHHPHHRDDDRHGDANPDFFGPDGDMGGHDFGGVPDGGGGEMGGRDFSPDVR